MIKRLAAAAISTLVMNAAAASGHPCGWQFVEQSDDGRLQLYFNSCSVKTQGANTFVSVRYKYGWPFYYKRERVLFQKQFWLFDCANQRFAATKQIFYDMHNKAYAFVSHHPTFTVEDAVVYSVNMKVCPKAAK